MHDGYGRQVDYLRLSITDRCNERCVYCMPADHTDWLPRAQILSYEELLRCVRVAVGLGFRRFRVTGGEPLVRRDAAAFIERLCAIAGVGSGAMTTNATRLADCAERLRRAGVASLNISLDALDAGLYHDLTRGNLKQALEGIDAARAAGFERIKLNTVLVRHANEGQLWPIVEFAHARGIIARFIELMPVSLESMLDPARFLPADEAQRIIAQHDELEPLPGAKLGHGPARYFRLRRLGATVGFISAMTDEHFCETCNKVRLTADGFLRPCLGNHGEADLKPALREAGGGDDAVADVFRRTLAEKPEAHLFRDGYTPLRIMTAIGG